MYEKFNSCIKIIEKTDKIFDEVSLLKQKMVNEIKNSFPPKIQASMGSHNVDKVIFIDGENEYSIEILPLSFRDSLDMIVFKNNKPVSRYSGIMDYCYKYNNLLVFLPKCFVSDGFLLSIIIIDMDTKNNSVVKEVKKILEKKVRWDKIC